MTAGDPARGADQPVARIPQKFELLFRQRADPRLASDEAVSRIVGLTRAFFFAGVRNRLLSRHDSQMVWHAPGQD
jgi:hypothetical protein